MKNSSPISMTIDERYWLGRRLLVTGHAGFKGSWPCIWLQSLGAELFGYALGPRSDPDLYTLGWRSHLDLHKTLELTVDWYRKKKMRDKVIS